MSYLDTLTDEQRRQFTRMQTVTITQNPILGECGFHAWARDIARALARALNGTEWHAEASAPYWPHPENEIHGQVTIMIDDRWTIVHTHRIPAHTTRDLFTIDVDGTRIPYHIQYNQPSDVDVIAANVRRHINGVPITGGCAALACADTPTVAAYGYASYCAKHAARYAETGR